MHIKHIWRQCYTIATEESVVEVAERVSFEAKWRLLARVGVRCYILISNVSGAVKVAPLQILQFPVILPHKFQDAEKFNLQFSDFSEITETADKLRWLRYQKGLRQRDVADYAGIDRSTYIHYEEGGRDYYPKEHMEKLAELFEVTLEDLLDNYNLFLLRGRRKLRFKRIASTAAVRTRGDFGIIPSPYDVDGERKMIVSISVKISEQNIDCGCGKYELELLHRWKSCIIRSIFAVIF